MSRFVYDETKVNSTLDILKSAKQEVAETSQAFTSALSEIQTASKNYLWIDTETLPAMPGCIETTIEELMSQITEKQAAIEEYNSSEWYEKLFGSAGMIITKIGEGIGTAGEQLLDGALTIVGFGVGFFSEDRKESISQFIEKDYVGDFFYEQYETGALKWINDKSSFSHTSTAANVFKGIGVATGYILAAAATGGAAGLAGGSGIAAGMGSGVSSIAANATLAGVGGIGSGTQTGLQNNLSFNEAALQGVKQGAIQAGTVFVAGKAIDKISSSGIANKVTDKIATKTLGKETVESLAVDGVTPARYAKEVLKTKVGNVASKVTSPIKTVGNKIDDAIGTKILGKETVESLAVDGVTPAGYAKEVLKTKVGNITSKVTSPIKTAGSKIDDAIGTKILGKEAMDSLKIDGGNFAKYVGTKIGSSLGGTTTGSMAAAAGNTIATGVNQTIVQNANSQFKMAMDPANHVELNADAPETIAGIEDITDSPAQNIIPTNDVPSADSINPTNENASGGTSSNGGTEPIPSNNTSSITQFRVENPTQVVPDANNNLTNPESNVELNSGSNIDSNTNTDTNISDGNTTTPTVPEEPSTDTNTGMSGDMTISEEPVPETPNSNAPIDNVGDYITDMADKVNGGSPSGNYNSQGSSVGSSIINGFNNNENSLEPEETLSYENKPGSEMLEGNDSNSTIDEGNTLDVISIDKDSTKNPSASDNGSSVIPTILGVGAAGAAGVAGVRYIQKKSGKNNEYYEDDFSEENNENKDNYNLKSSEPLNINDEQMGIVEDRIKYKAGGVNQLKLDDGADVKINDDDSIIAPQTKEELE